jgi:hypothetical protein
LSRFQKANLKPMTTEAFKALGDPDQRKFLLEQGAYLGHRKAAPWSVLLYQVQDFYVEVFFSMNNLDIQSIEAFDDLDRLEPYLERISLDTLLAC